MASPSGKERPLDGCVLATASLRFRDEDLELRYAESSAPGVAVRSAAVSLGALVLTGSLLVRLVVVTACPLAEGRCAEYRLVPGLYVALLTLNAWPPAAALYSGPGLSRRLTPAAWERCYVATLLSTLLGLALAEPWYFVRLHGLGRPGEQYVASRFAASDSQLLLRVGLALAAAAALQVRWLASWFVPPLAVGLYVLMAKHLGSPEAVNFEVNLLALSLLALCLAAVQRSWERRNREVFYLAQLLPGELSAASLVSLSASLGTTRSIAKASSGEVNISSKTSLARPGSNLWKRQQVEHALLAMEESQQLRASDSAQDVLTQIDQVVCKPLEARPSGSTDTTRCSTSPLQYQVNGKLDQFPSCRRTMQELHADAVALCLDKTLSQADAETPRADEADGAGVAFTVIGCGLPEFNGNYVEDGVRNGRPRYRHVGGGPPSCNFWDGAWYFSHKFMGDWYRALEWDGHGVPPNVGWSVALYGRGRPPTLVYHQGARSSPNHKCKVPGKMMSAMMAAMPPMPPVASPPSPPALDSEGVDQESGFAFACRKVTNASRLDPGDVVVTSGLL